VVTQVKNEKLGGVKRGGIIGVLEIRLISMELANLVREEVSKRLTQET